MAESKLNIYFPINNLNPQGWISEFITPVIKKTWKQRSDEANLFYDSEFNQNNFDKVKKQLTKDEQDNFFSIRKAAQEYEKKIFFLNGNFLDLLEVDAKLKGPEVTDSELEEYTKFMSQVRPNQAAFLQSYIKLEYGYKVNDQWKWISFPFKQTFDLDFILNNKDARSEGCGITSIDVDNAFNLGTQINSEIKINFFFGNLKILTQEIDEKGNPADEKVNRKNYPYGFSFMKLVENMDTTKELIRLEYGRKVAPGFEQFVGNNTALKDIIERKERKVYLLTKYSHDVKFDDKGTVTLGCSFYNFHDAVKLSENNISVPSVKTKDASQDSKDVAINLLQNDNVFKRSGISEDNIQILKQYNVIKNEIKKLDDQLKDAKSVYETSEVNKMSSDQKAATVKSITEKLAKLNKTLNLLKRSLKPNLTTLLLNTIKSQGQLFGVNFNTIKQNSKFTVKTNIFLVEPLNGDFKNMFSYNRSYDMNSIKQNSKFPVLYKSNNSDATDLLTRIYSRILNSPYDEKDSGKTYGHIMFFPLKALIYAAYSFLSPEEQKEIPHMLFGNVNMKVGTKICSINIGDLLIETGVFQKWYYNNFIKNDRLDYPFGSFMRDVINNLIPEAIHRNKVGFDNKAPISAVKEIQYYLVSQPDEKIAHDIYLKNDKKTLQTFCNNLSKNPDKNPKPLIYYGQTNNVTTQVPSPLFTSLSISEFAFKEDADAKKGIPHIKIGADGGLVNEISFNSSDFKKVRTALLLESLLDKASRYFFAYYQLNLTMLGNNLFNYDGVVCVPSSPLGIDSETNDPGIAGYYKVKSTKDSINVSNGYSYTTTAVADWVFNPKNVKRDKQKISSSPVASDFIVDYINADVNDPNNYIIDLLENDANTIIASQLQKLYKPQTKASSKNKKDNNKKTGSAKDKNAKQPISSEDMVDKNEKFNKVTPTAGS